MHGIGIGWDREPKRFEVTPKQLEISIKIQGFAHILLYPDYSNLYSARLRRRLSFGEVSFLRVPVVSLVVEYALTGCADRRIEKFVVWINGGVFDTQVSRWLLSAWVDKSLSRKQ